MQNLGRKLDMKKEGIPGVEQLGMKQDWELQMDVTTAFLHGVLEEVIYGAILIVWVALAM